MQNVHSYSLFWYPFWAIYSAKDKPVYETKPYFTFIFENEVVGDKIQLNRQYDLCTAAMECPE